MSAEEPLRKRPRLAVFRNATQALTIDSIRNDLIRQEETIIFALIERAQFARNAAIYDASSRALRDVYFPSSGRTPVKRSAVTPPPPPVATGISAARAMGGGAGGVGGVGLPDSLSMPVGFPQSTVSD